MEPLEPVLLEVVPVDGSALQGTAPGSLSYVLERLSNSSEFLNREKPPFDGCSHVGEGLEGKGLVGLPQKKEEMGVNEKPVLMRVGARAEDDLET